MRVRYVYVLNRGERRSRIETTPGEFADTLRYDRRAFADQDEFLSRCCRDQWVLEVHEVLRDWLPRGASILSIGSGLGEHEVLLYRAGYDVTASDFVEGAGREAVRLFPGFRAIRLDILRPEMEQKYDRVTVLGLDQYYDDDALAHILRNIRGLLKERGRVVFALRHHDNVCTRLLDYVLCPVVATLQNVKYRAEGRAERWARKIHGYARTPTEVARVARESGFSVGRVGHAGFAVEWTRLGLDAHLPKVYAAFRSLDRRYHCCNNVTLFEFVT